MLQLAVHWDEVQAGTSSAISCCLWMLRAQSWLGGTAPSPPHMQPGGQGMDEHCSHSDAGPDSAHPITGGLNPVLKSSPSSSDNRVLQV